MAAHDTFKLKSLEELDNKSKSLGANIPISESAEFLTRKVALGDKVIPNSIAIHPMEGCDGTATGEPGELTFRRYRRFAQSGAGLIWFEACAVTHDGRANPRQLFLTSQNKGSFKKLFDETLDTARERFGQNFKPYTVLQLTHSGRYSKPDGELKPIAAVKNPYLDERLPAEPHIISDKSLEALEDSFVKSARMAAEIGFDAVDIKSCHGYLIADMLAAHTRAGKYGGTFENRSRFLLNAIDKISSEAIKIDVTLRLNAFDAVPLPYGWGVQEDDYRIPDLNELFELIKKLARKNVRMINITAGNPYYNPHVNRPYDTGAYVPSEHPLEAVSRLLSCAREIQRRFPEMAVVSTGFSWLREFAANAGAGGIKENWFKIAGFGRQAFAYPDFASDIIEKGGMERSKCCITCSGCSRLMRAGRESGCPVRDKDVYGQLIKGL